MASDPYVTVSLNPMFFLVLQEASEQAQSAIESGLLDEEEAAQALNCIAEELIAKYIEIETV